MITVSHKTISRVLKGRRVYIPGALNRALSIAGRLVPATWIAKLLYGRWSSAQSRWLNEKALRKAYIPAS